MDLNSISFSNPRSEMTPKSFEKIHGKCFCNFYYRFILGMKRKPASTILMLISLYLCEEYVKNMSKQCNEYGY
jgi:hypothetical protein